MKYDTKKFSSAPLVFMSLRKKPLKDSSPTRLWRIGAVYKCFHVGLEGKKNPSELQNFVPSTSLSGALATTLSNAWISIFMIERIYIWNSIILKD